MRSAMIAVAVMAVGLVSAACGDDGGNQTEFCRDGATTLADLGTLDVGPASNEFEGAVDTLEEVDPPAAIQDDWASVVDTLVMLRDAESLDPETLAGIDQRFAALDDARARIDEYINDECGIDMSDPDS